MQYFEANTCVHENFLTLVVIIINVDLKNQFIFRILTIFKFNTSFAVQLLKNNLIHIFQDLYWHDRRICVNIDNFIMHAFVRVMAERFKGFVRKNICYESFLSSDIFDLSYASLCFYFWVLLFVLLFIFPQLNNLLMTTELVVKILKNKCR